MSKLSFRARALDASKPMPIYMSEELPDLPDYSAINRAVPQMPSGMEKEEECVSFLTKRVVLKRDWSAILDFLLWSMAARWYSHVLKHVYFDIFTFLTMNFYYIAPYGDKWTHLIPNKPLTAIASVL